MTGADNRRSVRNSVDPIVLSLETFEAFYRREYGAAVRLAYVLSGSRWGAEDLAQEAFIAAQQRWHEIGRYSNPGSWLRLVIANRSVSLYRRKLAEGRALVKALAGSRKALEASQPEFEEVWAAVRKLPQRQSQVIMLKYVEEQTLQEIAEVLGLSVPTVGTHLQRARKALAESLGTMTEEKTT
ncbi:MAG: RNA polymerase sigma factor [Acidimicrobiia bacterium]